MPQNASSPGLRALLGARKAEQQALLEAAKAFAARLRQDFPEARVFLYGSALRGDFNLHSDIDLLVVADLPRGALERAAVLYRYTSGREEPKGLRAEEFGRLSAQGKLEYLRGALEL